MYSVHWTVCTLHRKQCRSYTVNTVEPTAFAVHTIHQTISNRWLAIDHLMIITDGDHTEEWLQGRLAKQLVNWLNCDDSLNSKAQQGSEVPNQSLIIEFAFTTTIGSWLQLLLPRRLIGGYLVDSIYWRCRCWLPDCRGRTFHRCITNQDQLGIFVDRRSSHNEFHISSSFIAILSNLFR